MPRLSLLLITLTLAICSTATAQDASSKATPEQLAAAKRYMAVAPLQSQIERGLAAYAKQYPHQFPPDFQQKILKQIRVASLEAEYAAVLARVFTAPELDALSGFYATPVGRSVLDKSADFSAGVARIVSAELASAIAAAHQEPTQAGRRFATETINLLAKEVPRLSAALVASDADHLSQFRSTANQLLGAHGAHGIGPGPTKQFPACVEAIDGIVALSHQLASAGNRQLAGQVFAERANELLGQCRAAAGG